MAETPELTNGQEDTEVLENLFGTDISGDSPEEPEPKESPAEPKAAKGAKTSGKSKAPKAAATPTDPFAVLGSSALTEEGRALAGAVRHLQSVSDSRAARLEGQLQQIGQALVALRQPAPAAQPPEDTHPLANVQLTTEQREALGLVETLFEHRLKSSGLSGVTDTLKNLQAAVDEIRGSLGNQTQNTIQTEAGEILEAYSMADVQRVLPTLKGMRGLPHPETGRPMSLKAAMDVLTGGPKPEVEDTEDAQDLVLAAKRRAGRPPGAGGRSTGKLSPQELEAELAGLFGGV